MVVLRCTLGKSIGIERGEIKDLVHGAFCPPLASPIVNPRYVFVIFSPFWIHSSILRVIYGTYKAMKGRFNFYDTVSLSCVYMCVVCSDVQSLDVI